MKIGSRELRDLNAAVRRVGQAWENGKNTWEISLTLRKPESEIERMLHEYLHWRRTGNPALSGILLHPKTPLNPQAN